MAQRKHSPDILAAIETMAQAGKNAGEIARALAAGDFPGLAALPPDQLPPRRTIQHHAARARRELEPVPDADAFANALDADIIRLVRRDVRRLKRQATLSLEDSRLLAQHQKTIAQVAARGSSTAHPDRQRGGEERQRQRVAQPATILGQLGAALKERDGSGPVADGAQGVEGAGTAGTADTNGTADS